MLNQIRPDLYLVNLDQNIEGFRNFISSWIYTPDDLVLIVDPGPSSTIPVLEQALLELGIRRVDYILLTHIHIDHAGGTGLLLESFPEAKVNCHPRGIEHMIQSDKLWEGSLKVLGNIAEAYGIIPPVPAENISWNSNIKLNNTAIDVIETPGHAPHHVCYKHDDLLFAGEVAGVNVPNNQGDYLRIATPPVFKYEIYRDSLIRASKLNVNHICFGHYGLRSDPANLFKNAIDQLELWVEVIGEWYDSKTDEEIFQLLLETDLSIKEFPNLPEDIKKREAFFCLNSIKGIKGYFETK